MIGLPSPGRARWLIDRLSVAAVALVAVAVAATLLLGHAADPASLWRDVYHDRNGHFSFGLDLALDARAFDALGFLQHLEQATVWPPVHGLLLCLTLLLGGLDRGFEILPSLIGWVVTIVLTWLIARRMVADRLSGIAAAAIAVTFAAMSPGLRLLGADVMLEGLGSALTALVLYAYQRCAAAPAEARWWRILAVTLTLLFLEKYNYWVLAAAPLALAFAGQHRRTAAGAALAAIAWGRALRRLAGDPLVLAAAVLWALVVAIAVHGPTTLPIPGHPIALYPPANLATLAFGLLFLRLALAWRRHRATLKAALGQPGRAILSFHLLPLACWFLVPQTLYTFLWYVGPAHHGAMERYDPWAALRFQWAGFAEGFHVASWAAILAAGCAALGVVRMARLGDGARAVAILAVLSAVLVVLHPQQQWRFQATWLFALWICAGVGAATGLAWLMRRRTGGQRAVVAAAAVVVLLGAQIAQSPSPMADAVAIRRPAAPSDLALAAAYLPFSEGQDPIGIATTFGTSDLFEWTIHQHCRCRAAIDQPFAASAASRDEVRAITAAWLAGTAAERIILIDAPLPYEVAAIGLTAERMRGERDAMESQERFVRTATVPVPSVPAEVTVWQRRAGSAAPLPPPRRLHIMDAFAAAIGLGAIAIVLL